MENERVCPWWMLYAIDNPLRRLVHDPNKIFGPYVESGMTALDVGCGRGFNSMGLARIVGEQGSVISADMQQQALDMLGKRAAKAGLADRIQLHLCEADTIGVEEPVDFVNAFWMVHEAPDTAIFLGEVFSILKPGGKLLVAEPSFHVKSDDFDEMIEKAKKAGFEVCDRPQIRFSRSAAFKKP